MPLDFSSIANLFLYEQPANAPQATILEKPTPAPKTAGEQMKMDIPPREEPKAMSPAEFEKDSQEEELPFVMGDTPKTVPQSLADLMAKEGMSGDDLKAVVYAAGCYPRNTPLENMDPAFFDYMVSEWDKFLALSKKIKNQ